MYIETNIVPENGWLGYEFHFGMAYIQGLLLLVSGSEVFFGFFWAHFEIATKPRTKTPLDALRSSGNQLGVTGYLFGPNC